MKEYSRKYPIFSLCGLSCGLCPRFHTDGKSRCPGCGGQDFHLKHPACAVITCAGKHEGIEFCFECDSYPCDRYNRENLKDSFVSYRNARADLEKARVGGIENFINSLQKKVAILEELIRDYNDGKTKSFYCLAVNLLDIDDLEKAMELARGLLGDAANRASRISRFLRDRSALKCIELVLRK